MDPARPFCDLTGEYPESGGVARTCIADPNDGSGAGNEDAGNDDPDDGDGASEDPDGGSGTDAPASCTNRLAFVSSRDGNAEIYLSEFDGSKQINLTQSPEEESEPRWSPDGSRVAFVRDDEGEAIWTMNADGSDPVQLTEVVPDVSLSRPAWSPDGTRIAFVRFALGSGYQLWAVDASGGVPTELADASGGGDFSWSPDGTRIAYLANGGGNPVVATMNSDGTERTNRTTTAVYDSDPVWSPDGAQILFSSGSGVDADLWIMTAGAQKTRNLTNSPEGEASGGIFLPDGSKILYSRRGDLYSMNADGTGQQQLTSSGEDSDDFTPVVSPDGERIAWGRLILIDDTFTSEVFVANVDGTAATRLTPDGGSTPEWQPCR
jgi:TolB protein